jgi:hypothetical protein
MEEQSYFPWVRATGLGLTLTRLCPMIRACPEQFGRLPNDSLQFTNVTVLHATGAGKNTVRGTDNIGPVQAPSRVCRPIDRNRRQLTAIDWPVIAAKGRVATERKTRSEQTVKVRLCSAIAHLTTLHLTPVNVDQFLLALWILLCRLRAEGSTMQSTDAIEEHDRWRELTKSARGKLETERDELTARLTEVNRRLAEMGQPVDVDGDGGTFAAIKVPKLERIERRATIHSILFQLKEKRKVDAKERAGKQEFSWKEDSMRE